MLKSKKPIYKNPHLLIIIVLLLLAIIIDVLIGNFTNDDVGEVNNIILSEKEQVEIFCEVLQKDTLERLKTPATAIFPDCKEVIYTKNGTKIIMMTYVDAQNGFGALIRTNIYGELEVNETGGVIPKHVKIGDELIF